MNSSSRSTPDLIQINLPPVVYRPFHNRRSIRAIGNFTIVLARKYCTPSNMIRPFWLEILCIKQFQMNSRNRPPRFAHFLIRFFPLVIRRFKVRDWFFLTTQMDSRNAFLSQLEIDSSDWILYDRPSNEIPFTSVKERSFA